MGDDGEGWGVPSDNGEGGCWRATVKAGMFMLMLVLAVLGVILAA